MSNPKRRKTKKTERRIWLLSELNPDLTPHEMARLLAAAALEQQARGERAADEKGGSRA